MAEPVFKPWFYSKAILFLVFRNRNTQDTEGMEGNLIHFSTSCFFPLMFVRGKIPCIGGAKIEENSQHAKDRILAWVTGLILICLVSSNSK